MKLRMFCSLAVLPAMTVSAVALAEPYLPSDPRALGMGGASTATAEGPNSVLYNAALASPEMRRYRTGLTFPTVGGSLADREKFLDALDDFDDSDVIDRLEADLNGFNSTFDMIRARIDEEHYDSTDELEADIDRLASDLSTVDMTREELQERIRALSDKPVTFDIKGSGAFGTRIGGWGTGLHYQARGYGGGSFLLDEADFDLVDAVFGNAQGIVGCLGEAAEGDEVDQNRLEECRNLDSPDSRTADNFTSEFQFQGAVLSEFGLTLARDFDIGGRSVAIGFTPKLVEVRTYDYLVQVQDEADVSFSDREQTHSNANLDVGFAMNLRDDLRIGGSVRNLIPQSYDTVEGNEIDLDTQVRVGLSWDRRLFTLAADLDLTENAALGFGPDTRFLALGGELRPLSWLQLRAGYRMNLSSSDIIDDMLSVGFGLSPGPVHFDLGVGGNDDEVAGYMQFGFRFGG